ncbi:hypothetical protein [Paenibacillus jiagnxiensis]
MNILPMLETNKSFNSMNLSPRNSHKENLVDIIGSVLADCWLEPGLWI